MGYKIYRTCEDDELVVPTIHLSIKFGTFEKYISKIHEHQKLRGVLVYATGELYEQLSKAPGITPVTESTPAEDLCQMNRKIPV